MRRTAAGKYVLAKIDYVIVVPPEMMAWVVIEIANIRTVRRHRVGLEKIVGRPLGMDTIEIEAGETLGTGRVSVGRYITQDIFLSYERQFGGAGENKLGVEYSINRHLKIKGSGSDIGESALDFLWRLDY